MDTVQARSKEVSNGTEGLAPRDLSGGELRRGESLCQGPTPGFTNAHCCPLFRHLYPEKGIAPKAWYKKKGSLKKFISEVNRARVCSSFILHDHELRV